MSTRPTPYVGDQVMSTNESEENWSNETLLGKVICESKKIFGIFSGIFSKTGGGQKISKRPDTDPNPPNMITDFDQTESIITDPDKINKLISDIYGKEDGVYFRRDERGISYYCQIKSSNEEPQPFRVEKPQPSRVKPSQSHNIKHQQTKAVLWPHASTKAKSEKKPDPLLVIYNMLPVPNKDIMKAGQKLTVMFPSSGWHYRADLSVVSDVDIGLAISYPKKLTKIGRQRECFRAVAIDTDTSIRITREAGCFVI